MNYPTPQDTVAIEAAEKLMEGVMANYDPSHDKYHVYRVRKTALHIARSFHSLPSELKTNNPPDPPDLLVVELASLLHDIFDKKYISKSPSSSSSIDSDTWFLSFFKSLIQSGGPDLISNQKSNLIIRIIQNVSWSRENKLIEEGGIEEWHRDCVELGCVQDADRLDAIGAFGIMRCAAYSTVSNEPLHTPQTDPKQTESATQHFHDKLLHIIDRMKTPMGKRLAVKRHTLMVDFLAAVDEESNLTLNLET